MNNKGTDILINNFFININQSLQSKVKLSKNFCALAQIKEILGARFVYQISFFYPEVSHSLSNIKTV